VLFHLKALESETFLQTKAGVAARLGAFPAERINPNGRQRRARSSVRRDRGANPQPGGQGARRSAPGSKAIVSNLTDGGQGAVALLEAGAA
jgi:acetyl-CoA C-acetyltransferase